MNFVSTRGRSAPAPLREALFAGLAPDGGLYLPETLSPLPAAARERFRDGSLVEISVAVARHLLADDLPGEKLAGIVAESLDFEIPLREVEPDIWSLELHHGPTLAFKDVGARFMSRLMSHFIAGGEDPWHVLVATSGDTGGAVAHAFHRLEPFRVVILFPAGKLSARQRKQFTTLGDNVRAVAIDGTFDDCQALVKRAFLDESLRSRLRLASANSINVGRLLPQIFYYFHAAARLPAGEGPVVISVPSGNFGNLTAGLIARRLGLPCERFVAATNANSVVPEYLETGRYRVRPSRATLSNAMDVGHPSNFERIRHLYGGDRSAIGRDLIGFSFDDLQTRGAISDLHARAGYLLDPHSAVGYLGLREGLNRLPGGRGIFLSTAHPAKFPEVVEEETGAAPPLPRRLRDCLDREESSIPLSADYDAFRKFLPSA